MSLIPQSWKARKNFAAEGKVALLVGVLLAIGIYAHAYAMPRGTMLILRGIAADNAPKGQLDDFSATLYALRGGYGGQVLNVAGGTGEQMKMTLDRIHNDPNVTAIYGFSGGAYTTANLWNQLTPQEKSRIRKIVIVGAPGVTAQSFPGAANVVVQDDPPEGHMEGPRALLQSWK
ncbi:MAG: hypothetical protein KIT15_12155 [Xanthobacteraceae bacterium]|nr:hypothetical protein [Xanthobacteraceae bacterium]MCW5675322.1 hypothetical protein [Xanthobacteraceae bacterium]